MATPWLMCGSGSAIAKAGAQANSTITASGSTLSNWSVEAEASFNCIVRQSASTSFSSLTSEGKEVAQKYCSAYIAHAIVNYDIKGYVGGEANQITNVLINQMSDVQKLIADDKVRKYLLIT